MHRSLFVFVLVLAAHGIVVGQTPLDVLERLQEIKLLESDRHDVRRVLADYVATDDDGHYQEFSMGDVSVTVSYSSGTCSGNPEDDDESQIWNVSEWKVTRIEIEPDAATSIKNSGFNLSEFTKEQMYRFVLDEQIYHDKACGLAIETDEDLIETIILFPPSSRAGNLCEGIRKARQFYSRKSWFSQKLEDRSLIEGHQVANVTALDLSAIKIRATSGRTISVTTTAVDPENDTLFYNYTVSAGQIRGTGAKVTWDLTGVPPGTYTITAGVDDGCGICGKTETRSVVVE